ncbi:HesB/YadR/YfhF family protein [Mesobacillus subterraneus]|uniref:FeS cluster biogenesis domain-containing protein n=1 Tax=Mesobacillus subterraneus TaxID=285983 RepID=A0A3R9EA13_9BACI|nr:hypothetical protein [Mesobacillus subterraneus]RSD25535.1 hypothetical protein EJA10_17165 [Mesobacillus subterraneus]
MTILIDQHAYKWFEKEFDTPKPFYIRLYPQYAGFGDKNKGYSLAFALETPAIAAQQQEIDGITFYVESNDIWFFDDTDVEIKFNDHDGEIFAAYTEHQ